MSDHHALTIDLHEEAFDFVRAKVASGQFESAGAVIEKSLSLMQSDAEYFEKWMQTEIVRRHDELKANPELGMSLEEVESSLAEEFGDHLPTFRKAG